MAQHAASERRRPQFHHWMAHLSHRITALYHWSLAGYSNLRDRLDYLVARGDSFAHVWHGRTEGAMVLTVLHALHDPSAGGSCGCFNYADEDGGILRSREYSFLGRLSY